MAPTQEHKNKHIWNNEEPQPIAVPLLGHRAPHNGNADHQRDYGFVGREHLIKELITILNGTRNSKGCYLISGFRGTGKTTLINKVLYLYSRGKTGPAWLPDVGEKNDSDELMSLLDSGLKKLKELNPSPATPENNSPTPENISTAPKNQHKPKRITNRVANWAETIKKYFKSGQVIVETIIKYFKSGQVITVRINLGQDESLSSREVLFNTATLLHHKLRDKRKLFLIPFLIIVSLFTWIAEKYLGEGFSAWLSKTLAERSLPAWLDWLNLPSPIGSYLNSLLFIGFGVFAAVYCLWFRCLPTSARILLLLKRLEKRMAYAVELNKTVKHHGFSLHRKETMPPLDARQIENELLHILKQCRNVFWLSVRPDIIFIFDELDKISHRPASDSSNNTIHASVGRDMHGRKKKVDDLLGALKNFITHGHARFFFIAGREMLDSYQAERGSTSSLYESLFSRIFEVPSLLTDSSDHNQQRMHSLLEVYVCRKLMDPDIAIYLWLQYTNRHRADDPCWEKDLHRKLMYSPFCLRTYYHYLHFVPDLEGLEARRIVLGLRNFIQFLTLHAWGNPKRMESLFAHFTKSIDSVDWRQGNDVEKIQGPSKNVTLALEFSLLDQQRIVPASNLYTHLYHDLGRQLTSSGDKLAVSTMAAFQYILKFHRHPFSRYHLERMSETLSVYHSPELNTMIDTLVSKVFHQHIRRIRNSHYRYRFSGDFEQELRYISRVSDIESATFNFSLDAAAPIKAHYIDQLKDMTNKSASRKSSVAIYELCMIIGDLFALEQSHDEAFTYYQRAVDVFDINKCSEDLRMRFTHFYVEALLRLGEIYEQRQRYDQAASVYLQADSAVNKLRTGVGGEGRDALSSGDSKWDLFRQPFWAYWYLQLKRSPVPLRGKLPPLVEYPFNNYDDPVNHYRVGQLAFFYGCHYTAVQSFIEAVNHRGIKEGCTERTTHLGAYAYLHLGENLFVGMMRYKWNKLNKKNDCKSGNELTCATGQAVEVGKFIRTAIESIKKIESLNALERTFSGKSAESYLGKLSRITDEDTFIKHVDIGKTLGMMAYAARLLAERGLHYHAAFAYLKILSLWGMISEVLFVLAEVGHHVAYGAIEKKSPLHLHRSDTALTLTLRQSEKWITEVRKKAEKSITYLTMGGFDRFHARWVSRDVESIKRKDEDEFADNKSPSTDDWLSNLLDSKWTGEIAPLLKKQKERMQGFALEPDVIMGHKLKKSLDLLFPGNDKKYFFMKREILRVRSPITRRVHEPVVREPMFLQRSMMGQKLIHLSIWEYMAKVRFRSKREPLMIPHQAMVPHSTRNLMFSHWLTGRWHLHWHVLDKLKKIEDLTLKKDDEKEKLKEIYEASSASVHNLHRAIYYSRQLSGNDQDLMFPDPSMVLYDLWCLLYGLIRWELENATPNKSFGEAVDDVKRALSSSNRRRENTPGNFYDFNNVTIRTIDALRDVENLGDISNRVRTNTLKTRHFLADDYEDPRFHLDWTLVQMYSPVAGILRRYVESASDNLSKDSLKN